MKAATGRHLQFKAFHGPKARLIAIIADEEGAQGNALGDVLDEHLHEVPPTQPTNHTENWMLVLYVYITCMMHFNRYVTPTTLLVF